MNIYLLFKNSRVMNKILFVINEWLNESIFIYHLLGG